MIFSRGVRNNSDRCRRMVDQAEIHRKVVSSESWVREREEAADQLRDDFATLPDKERAWQDLHRLIQDEDSYVRKRALAALGSAFPHIPDKEQAWQDLHRLTQDEYRDVRSGAAYVLPSVFQQIPDKEKVWQDLIRLSQDEYVGVRRGVAYSLVAAFPHIPDKEQAWKALIRLSQDEDYSVRWHATDVLSTAFQQILDKEKVWQDLHQLTQNENSDVRASANHSLGRASIFKATEAEDEEDFKRELNNAIDFFKRSSNEASYFNPSSFCLPFYRSFYTIVFEKTESEAEVQRYLVDAKSASEGSKNKEQLLEAVENLANALSEAQKMTGFDATKSNLKTYMQYCNRAADLIGDAAEDAPGAAGILRRGMPIIGERIREIQETAEALCRETRGTGTPYEPLGMEVNKWAGELSDRDYLRNEKNVSRIINSLGEFCNLLPEGEKEYPCKIVEEIREEIELEDKLSGIPIVLSYLLPSIKSEIQNAAKPTTDEIRSDEQPSHKTGHSTTVFAGEGSNVTVTQTETGSGDVTVTNDAKATKELQPEEHRTDHWKKTAIEIIAAIAVSVLVGIVSSRYLEDLTPTSSMFIAFIAFIILLIIILTQNRDRSS